MASPLAENLMRWAVQTLIVAAVGALLPTIFHRSHPRTQLAYGHALLAVCLALPFLQAWHEPPRLGRVSTTAARSTARELVEPPASLMGPRPAPHASSAIPEAARSASPPEAGWLAAAWDTSETNRRAKYYTLTKAGRRQLGQETTQWNRIALAMARALET